MPTRNTDSDTGPMSKWQGTGCHRPFAVGAGGDVAGRAKLEAEGAEMVQMECASGGALPVALHIPLLLHKERRPCVPCAHVRVMGVRPLSQ